MYTVLGKSTEMLGFLSALQQHAINMLNQQRQPLHPLHNILEKLCHHHFLHLSHCGYWGTTAERTCKLVLFCYDEKKKRKEEKNKLTKK